MKRGILASTGKLLFGRGYFSRNLLNCLICLLQNDKIWMRGRNCSMSKGYILLSQRFAFKDFYELFLIVICLLFYASMFCTWLF
jgi:hypothetical protein